MLCFFVAYDLKQTATGIAGGRLLYLGSSLRIGDRYLNRLNDLCRRDSCVIHHVISRVTRQSHYDVHWCYHDWFALYALLCGWGRSPPQLDWLPVFLVHSRRGGPRVIADPVPRQGSHWPASVFQCLLDDCRLGGHRPLRFGPDRPAPDHRAAPVASKRDWPALA